MRTGGQEHVKTHPNKFFFFEFFFLLEGRKNSGAKKRAGAQGHNKQNTNANCFPPVSKIKKKFYLEPQSALALPGEHNEMTGFLFLFPFNTPPKNKKVSHAKKREN